MSCVGLNGIERTSSNGICCNSNRISSINFFVQMEGKFDDPFTPKRQTQCFKSGAESVRSKKIPLSVEEVNSLSSLFGNTICQKVPHRDGAATSDVLHKIVAKLVFSSVQRRLNVFH
jgi:hypothetical protein